MATVKTAIPSKALEPIEAVTASLKAACKASGSMLQACKEAAKAAARQLDANLPLVERINKVMLCYKDVIGGDNNVRANFKDGLTLLACAQAPVSIEVRGVEVHTTAEKALDLPKHAMKAAAQAVRADNGIGRMTIAKRVPAQPSAPVVTPVDQMMRIIASNIEAVEEAFIAKLKATLAANGYLLKKK